MTKLVAIAFALLALSACSEGFLPHTGPITQANYGEYCNPDRTAKWSSGRAATPFYCKEIAAYPAK